MIGGVESPADSLEELTGELVMLAGRLVRQVRHATPDAPALRLLVLLHDHGPTTIGQIAALDGVSQPSVTQAVHRLTDRGWLARSTHPDDARATLVSLTDDGLEALREIRTHNAALMRERLLAADDEAPDLDDVAAAVAVLRTLTEGH